MTETAQPATSVPSSSTLLTFLIADVRGYTRFTVEQGDEAAARLADRFAELCTTVIERHGGQVIELRGDEALSVFPSARNALRGAVALQRAFREVVRDDPSLPLTVGMGLDAGEAIPVRGGYRGGALNLAARLCSIAGGGEIFASEGVVHLVRKTEGLAFVDRGQVTLKGLAAPVRVLQIAPEGELPDELPPLQPILVTHPNNLPDEPTPFIGRQREIDQIAGLLQDPHIRMVTLTGTGGTGKTRLALQVGTTLLHDFADGVFFVNLAPLANPALVSSAIAEVLEVEEEAGTELLERLVEHLKEKHLLLVLDNFEHLLDASAVVASLLDACRDLHILVTSRIPPHLTREHEYPVPPLAVPDPKHLPDLKTLSQYEAVALFIQRARAVKPGFAVTNENAPAVAEICYRLDGLPLAIELAAARIKALPPRALLQRLSSRLKLLTGGARDRPSRQQTLRGTIDWSYSLLSAEEQTLFARLSVFADGCTCGAAEAVCNGEGDLDLLERLPSLVDNSLLRQEGEDEPRFLMLETLREYAREKLDERGEGEVARAAHAGYFLGLAEEAEPELTGSKQGDFLSRLDREMDNLRAALRQFLDHGQVEEALRLAGALHDFWECRGYGREGGRWLEEGLAAGGGGIAPGVRAKALLSLGELAFPQGDLKRATPPLEEALGLSRELGDRLGSARALNGLGCVADSRGQYERATVLYEESLRLFRELGDQERLAVPLGNLGHMASVQGDLAMAKERFEEALTIFRSIGSPREIAWVLMCLGWVAIREGKLVEAEARLEESLTLAREVGAKQTIAASLENLGMVARMRGQLASSAKQLREGLLLARELGDAQCTIQLIGQLAALAAAGGHGERAARLAGAEAASRERFGMPVAPVDVAESEEALCTARKMLGEEEFTRVWERGRAMSLEEAVAYALEERG